MQTQQHLHRRCSIFTYISDHRASRLDCQALIKSPKGERGHGNSQAWNDAKLTKQHDQKGLCQGSHVSLIMATPFSIQRWVPQMSSEWLLADFHWSTTHLSGFTISLLNCKDVNIWFKRQISACQERRRADVHRLMRTLALMCSIRALLTQEPASVSGVARAEVNQRQSTEGARFRSNTLTERERERGREEGMDLWASDFSEEVLILLCWCRNKVTGINLLALWNYLKASLLLHSIYRYLSLHDR